MKEELINSIVAMLQQRGVSTEGIPERLYILFKDVEVTKAETALAIPDANINDDLLKRFIAAKMVKGCTENTITAYRGTISRCLQRFNKPATNIQSDDIRLYIAYRLTQDGVSKSFMNTELRYLRSFFTWMTSDEIIDKNPMTRIDTIKTPKISKKAFSDIECEKLRAACTSSKDAVIVEVLLSTGCRVSELCNIQLQEITNDRVTVHGKGQKDRTVYLNAKAQLAIARYLSDRKDNNPYLLPGSISVCQTGKAGRSPLWYTNPKLISDEHLESSSVERTVRTIGKRAGVENVHPHRFRRTCATMALRRGMSIEMVSKMLGHEQLSTTQIYLDLTESDLEAAHRKFVV